MTDSSRQPPFARALAAVERFSEKAVAVMPEQPSEEALRYIAHVTGEDTDKLIRLYQLFLQTSRLDGIGHDMFPAAGFAEDDAA